MADWPSRLRFGRQAYKLSVKNLSGNEKYGLGTVRLSGINLGNGKVLIRWEDSDLEFSYCGTV